jgi:hypothetical protein
VGIYPISGFWSGSCKTLNPGLNGIERQKID